ncbi:co-chaperone GroES [Candidatus Nomurabacteria bacterium]|uniref:Co-chaperonin GroES n=1 Tax=candidate division WWE3 bacterium TaxID=2053526 RepID=A0A955DZH5_UNCKA|nr:co-chaperone GroES [candidate division WWE3 bacterium]MCB9823522.1 co-chaperone GroES [Candidatus Nomurabacteria bacterium]MCB9827317.1 co-chaperone GroES [Candidatus Nomurabacteria bacterium]HXK52409.1 co-chaperone GroES [bacterium]
MADTKIKPMFDYILIEPLEEETTTPSGIVIPDTAKEKPQKGRVIAAGAGKRGENGDLIKMEVEVGAIVMYKKWGGTEVKVNGKEHLLVKQDDVLAVVE